MKGRTPWNNTVCSARAGQEQPFGARQGEMEMATRNADALLV